MSTETETEDGKTFQEIMELGTAAAHALNAPIFRYANKIAIDQCVMDWVNTMPKEREKRESLWAEIQAHGRINEILVATAERARQLYEQEQRNKKENRHLDEQGFGLDEQYPLQ